MTFERELARKLGSRRRAFIHGVLVMRAQPKRALTLVTPATNKACVTNTVKEVWNCDHAFVWVMHDDDKMQLHSLRTGKLSKIPHPPAAELTRVEPAREPRRRRGRDYHQQLMYDQITRRRRFPWRGALRRCVLTLIMPPGLVLLVVPARVQRHTPVIDMLTEARIGNVCNLWGTGLQPLVLEARKHFPMMS